MLNPRLAGRYAKSLIDLSLEQGQLEAVYADMLVYERSMMRESPRICNYSEEPGYSG